MVEFIYSEFRTQVRLCSSFYDQDLHRRLGSHLFQAWLASPCIHPLCSSIYFPFQQSIPLPCLPFVPKWSSVSYCGAVKTRESCRSWLAPQSPPCLAQHAALSWWGSVHRTVSLSLPWGSWVNTANLWPHWFAFLRELNLFLFVQNFPRRHTEWLMTSPFSKIQLYFNPVTLKGDLGVLKLWAHSCRNSFRLLPPTPFLLV